MVADLGSHSSWIIPGIAGIGSLIVALLSIWLNNLGINRKIHAEATNLNRKVAADRIALEVRIRSEAEAVEARLKATSGLEYASENVALTLMQDPNWKLRSFDAISHHLGGFTPDELRQILVRVGAIRFYDQNKREYWGLLARNRDSLGKMHGPQTSVPSYTPGTASQDTTSSSEPPLTIGRGQAKQPELPTGTK